MLNGGGNTAGIPSGARGRGMGAAILVPRRSASPLIRPAALRSAHRVARRLSVGRRQCRCSQPASRSAAAPVRARANSTHPMWSACTILLPAQAWRSAAAQ
jgi:hypothetical protein